MTNDERTTRRRFIDRSLRIAGLAGLGAAALKLALPSANGTVFQVDPAACLACDLCRTSCVLPLSAVKAVNDFAKCGYCMLCPAYFDVTTDADESGTPIGRVCPQDALKRRVVGKEDKDDPNNNSYEYKIDETRCDGCGKCVKACKPPAGNGSLRLEIRYDRCLACNSCAIQVACPYAAVVRMPTPGLPPEEPSEPKKA